MAAVLVSKQQVPVITGLQPTYNAAAADGNLITVDDGDTLVHVKNGSGSSITATFDVTATVNGRSAADDALVIDAGEEAFIRLTMADHNQGGANQGKAKVTWSATTDVTFAVIR